MADAAYHGRPLRELPDRVTFTTRVQRNAALYAPAPPPTGKRGRPRTRGDRIGNPTQAGAGASWRQTSVTRYGRTDTVAVAEVTCLWYGAFGKRHGRLVLVRDRAAATTRELALFSTDLTSTVEQIIARYAGRWSVEVAIETAKGPLGVGQARNYLEQAVERTVPFAMLNLTILTLWYHHAGNATVDIAARRTIARWYRHKRHIAVTDMLTAFRRARITDITAAHDTPQQNPDKVLTWGSVAA